MSLLDSGFRRNDKYIFSENKEGFIFVVITLRPAGPDDKEFCLRVHRWAYRDVVVKQFGHQGVSLQDGFFEREWIAKAYQIIEADGQAVGSFSREICSDYLSITGIQLLPKFQGQGIGTELLERQLDDARRLKLPVRLEVLHENRARNLYERLGFQVFGRNETHYLMEWIFGT